MHLVKSYGPHTGQPRTQEAMTSARSSGLRNNAMLGGVADEDDVEGILQQVRKDVRGIQASQPSRGRELDGRWCVKGHNVQIVINDGAVMALGGQPQLITFEGAGQFYINDQGSRVDGVLVGTEIHWSDGDVWIAMQDLDSGNGQSSAAKSLSRNRSDATWDRPRTRETQEAPRAQPKPAAVRGRYVFSGGAETQVLGGQLDRQRATTDFSDDRVVSQSLLTPRKPGGTSARTSAGATSTQRHLRSLPELTDCTDLP